MTTVEDQPDIEPLIETSKVLVAIALQSLDVGAGQVGLAQLRVLVVLAQRESSELIGLASALGVSPSRASRLCERLVQDSLVARVEKPSDRRRRELTLTTEGRELVERVFAERRRLLAEVVARMPAPALERLVDAVVPFNDAGQDIVGTTTHPLVRG